MKWRCELSIYPRAGARSYGCAARGTKGALPEASKVHRMCRSRSRASCLLPPYATHVREPDPTGQGRWRKQAAKRGGRRRSFSCHRTGAAAPSPLITQVRCGSVAGVRVRTLMRSRQFPSWLRHERGCRPFNPVRGHPRNPRFLYFGARGNGAFCPHCLNGVRGRRLQTSAFSVAPHPNLLPVRTGRRDPEALAANSKSIKGRGFGVSPIGAWG
jgi:hypothetical protein